MGKNTPQTRIFLSRWFERFAKKAGIADSELTRAIRKAEKGLIDANLGGGVIKLRLARPKEGKSGGFRSVVIFRSADRAVFVYGFAKNRRSNLQPNELAAYKELAEEILACGIETIENSLRQGVFREVLDDEKAISK